MRIAFVILLIVCTGSVALASAVPVLVHQDVTVNEGEVATVHFQLSHPVAYPVRVTCSTRYGNAISGQDFVSKSKRITFAPGTTDASVSFQVKQDNIDEPDQFFWAFFRNPSGIDVPNNRARITIIDDDPEPMIRFDRSVQSFIEGTSSTDTTANIRVRLSHRSEKKIRFTVHTAPNTATEFEYRPVAERVLYNSKGVIFNYPVELVGDSDLEGRAQFYLYMRNPSNAKLALDDPTSDRIRTTIRILDDDVLVPPADIYSANSFAWIGAFGRRFTNNELDAIATNSDFVVLAKFHASFDIFVHDQETALLKSRKPSLKVLPYFNSKHWFVESQWGTQPDPSWLLKDENGDLVTIPTDRSDANYFDLRIPACRQWILDTIAIWMDTGLYDGIAFDSTGPVGDVGEGTFWQDLLGGQSQVDAWNAGMASLLQDAQTLLQTQGLAVIFNGIGQSNFRGSDRDTFQLAYTDGALNESFAIEPFGEQRSTLLDDIDLMQLANDKIFLMKTNVFDNGDAARRTRIGRFAYGCFLMGWVPGKSYFKYGVDDYYTTAELEDYPTERQLDLGLPVGPYSISGSVLFREFDNYFVYANIGETEATITHSGSTTVIPAQDVLFLATPED